MAIIRVTVEIDIDTTNINLEDLRDDILDVVAGLANTDPEIFLLEPLDQDIYEQL